MSDKDLEIAERIVWLEKQAEKSNTFQDMLSTISKSDRFNEDEIGSIEDISIFIDMCSKIWEKV